MITQAIGWISSIVLVATIAKQVHKQWKAGTSAGVSTWLFVGQITASTGFTIYSFLIREWVFVFTNSLMLASGVLGLLIVRYHRRKGGTNRAEEVL
jgi:MtN3 and saliva related transmembrane protein